ncbi:hypothetical protein LG634_32090 [Streptomyces bambusae]|uniref:nSTAND1 domain-containing NTPase n=1 Tax=Streptomyces bambusae TaxID=1550616 RepID=UPI001CFF9B0D|nr:hypothetical protein [Streptomyces bambusae]MCB5169438.1 hypothetical protein [Streptomyces bambusae]
MGRREKEIDPAAGPAAEFAAALRALRAGAGSPTYAAMARRAGTYSVATLSRAAAGGQLPSLPVVLAYVGVCGGDAVEWEERWRRVSGELTARAAEDDREAAPYRGLARFEPGNRDVFFGREELVGSLAALTRSHRVVTVFGPSGSGKSSLLRAGLVPLLQELDPAPAAVRLLTPGAQPPTLRQGALLPADGPGDTWLIVDQFEELFTLCTDVRRREAFVDLLLAADAPDSRIRVILAVRADFYPQVLGHAGLAAAVARASLPIGPMSRSELRAAITGPAAARSVVVERALTSRIIDEVHNHRAGLPLLSHVLLETWRRRRAKLMTLASYEEAGGIQGAVSRSAEAFYMDLTRPQAEAVRRILLRLISPGRNGLPDTRRPAHPDELVQEGPVLDALVRARLVTVDENAVELAHEALISAWPRLEGWIEESRDELRRHRRLTDAARSWEELGRHSSALATQALLAAFGDLVSPAREGELNAAEAAFVRASLRARRARGHRRTALRAVLTLLTAVAVLAGTVAWQQDRAQEERQVLDAAVRAAALAEGLRFSDAETAGHLSAAAWRMARTPETRAGLLAAVSERALPDFTAPAGGPALRNRRAALAADGATVTVQAADRVERWDLRTRKRLLSHRIPGAPRPQPVPDEGADYDWLDPYLLHLSPRGTRVARVAAADPARPGAGRDTRKTPGPVEVRSVATGTTSVLRPEAKAAERPAVRGLSWSGDERFLGIDLGTRAEVWDVVGRRRVLAVAGSPFGSAIALSADGSKAAVCGSDGFAHVWDTAGGREAYRAALPSDLDQGSRICSRRGLELSADGRNLAVRTDAGIRFTSLDEEAVLERRKRSVLPVAAPYSGTVRQPGVTAFATSADFRFLATLTSGSITLWRTVGPGDPLLVQTIPVWGDSPRQLRIDTQQGVVRYLGLDGLTVRSVSAAASLKASWRDPWAETTYLSPNGQHAVTHVREAGGRQRMELRDVRGERVLARLPAPPADAVQSNLLASFSADGTLFAYGPSVEPGRQGRFTVWDTRKQHTAATVAFAAGGEQGLLAVLPVAGPGPALLPPRLYGISSDSVWDLQRRARVHTFAVPEFKFAEGPWNPSAVEHPQGPQLTLGDGTVIGLDGARLRPAHGTAAGQTAQTWDGSVTAFADRRGRISLWNARTETRIGSLLAGSTSEPDGNPVRIAVMAFSRDRRMLATGDDLGRIRLWDVATLRALGGPMRTPGDPVHSLAFAPDGRTLYTKGTHTPVQRLPLTPEVWLSELCKRLGKPLDQDRWRTLMPDTTYRPSC